MRNNQPTGGTQCILLDNQSPDSCTDLPGIITFSNADSIAASGYTEDELPGQALVKEIESINCVIGKTWDSYLAIGHTSEEKTNQEKFVQLHSRYVSEGKIPAGSIQFVYC